MYAHPSVKPRRILLLNERDIRHPNAGGAEVHCFEVYRRLAARGDDVTLLAAGFPGAGTPAPGNDLSPYVTDMGLALARLYPLPNYRDPSNRYNYADAQLRPTDRRHLTARFDLKVNSATQG